MTTRSFSWAKRLEEEIGRLARIADDSDFVEALEAFFAEGQPGFGGPTGG